MSTVENPRHSSEGTAGDAAGDSRKTPAGPEPASRETASSDSRPGESPGGNGRGEPVFLASLSSPPPVGRASANRPELPAPPEEPADPVAVATELRRFHLGRSAPGEETGVAPDSFLPALLQPYREARLDPPWFLPPPGGDEGEDSLRPVAHVLAEAAARADSGEARGRLPAHLPAVERWVCEAVDRETGPVEAHPVLARAGKALRKKLALPPEEDEALAAEYAAMLAGIPGGGTLLPSTENVALHLLLAAARERRAARWSELRSEIEDLARALRTLLEVERSKDASAREPDALEGSVGSVGQGFFDLGQLSGLLPSPRGSVPMEPDRRKRIEEILEVFGGPLPGAAAPDLVVLHDGSLDTASLEDEAGCRVEVRPRPCEEGIPEFDREAAAFVELFRAVRVARLEREGRFDARRHVAWAEAFDAASFSREELLLLPVVVVVESPDRVAGEALPSLSRLLLSERPVRVHVSVPPARDPEAASVAPGGPGPVQLGYLGIALRKALVHQTSAADLQHLYAGLRRSVDVPGPSLHVLCAMHVRDGSSLPPGRRTYAGAALESRAHPYFLYDPASGSTWSRRLEFSGNPQPDEDWPGYTLEYEEGGEKRVLPIRFTFADFALLDPAFAADFRVIPDGCPDESIASVADYLDLDGDEAIQRTPFVWGVDGAGQLRRLAVSRRLVRRTREVLDFWHTLQELAGIRNDYVLEAVRVARGEEAAKAAAERDALEAAHREEVERVRRESAEQAMQGLARSLLETDWAAPPEGVPASAPASPAPPAQAPAEPAPPAEEEEDLVLGEPWIDSSLCTSCDDCININRLLFTYDENKQARIADAGAGTFAQLVQAAEKCPARCIHPGKPRNPDEPGLDGLMKRAEPFQ